MFSSNKLAMNFNLLLKNKVVDNFAAQLLKLSQKKGMASKNVFVCLQTKKITC